MKINVLCIICIKFLTSSNLFFNILTIYKQVSSKFKVWSTGPSPAWRPVVPGPPFEICASVFHVWPPGCCTHPILYFKNVALPFGFWPPSAVKSWRWAWWSNI